MEVSVTWEGKRKFAAIGNSGHQVVMDAKAEVGGEDQGARPMELLLMGLGGCTGIDIMMILEKMRFTVDDFRIEVSAERREQHPQKFTAIHMNYILQGQGLTREKVERAIRLSEEKYCSASASLNAEIHATYELNGIKYELREGTANDEEDPLQ